jgi:hypothetical protein
MSIYFRKYIHIGNMNKKILAHIQKNEEVIYSQRRRGREF